MRGSRKAAAGPVTHQLVALCQHLALANEGCAACVCESLNWPHAQQQSFNNAADTQSVSHTATTL